MSATEQPPASLNPLQNEEDALDENYYRRLTKELTRGGGDGHSGDGESGMIGSRTYTEEDYFNNEDGEKHEQSESDHDDDHRDLYHDQADRADRIAEQFENRRDGTWKRHTGPKARGQKAQEILEKLRIVTASLNAAEQYAAQLRLPPMTNVGGGAPHVGGGGGPAPNLPQQARNSLSSKFDPRKVLDICEHYDEELTRLLDPTSKSCSLLVARVPSVPGSCEEPLVAAYDHMIENLYTPYFFSRFGGHGDDDLLHLPYGGSVPSYFANVGGETIFRRKMLSILGLRNLIKHGPRIFTDLRNQLFSGNPAAYTNSTGLGLMRAVTGNVLDLDTTVLRLTDRRTMDAVNMMNKHKGLPVYHSLEDFARSSDAREIAVHCAKSALQDFIDLFKLTKEAAVARKVLPDSIDPHNIPVASSNVDRGHWPMWHYNMNQQNSMHANCPTMDDVIGGLLKAPFHCIKHYAFMCLQATATVAAASSSANNKTSSSSSAIRVEQSKLDKFFNECVVDSCFNFKWKAIEEYGAAVAHEGTIVDVLQKLQMTNQSVFSAEFFAADDDNNTKEKEKMLELVQQNRCLGKEAASGKIRQISKEDVDKWVSDPSCKI